MRYTTDITDTKETARRINALHDPAAGRFVVPLLAGQRNVSGLTGALARALGKRQDRHGWIGAGQHSWELLQSWIIGDQVSELIIVRAHLLRFRAGWDYLAELARLCNVQVTFIIQGTAPSETQLRAIRDHHIDLVTLEDILSEHGDAHQPAPASGGATVDELTEIPFGDPFQFAVALDDQDEAVLAWSHFRELRELACDELATYPRPAFQRQTYEFLRAWFTCATSRNDVLLRLRAAQSALFEKRWLLRSDDARVVAFAANAHNATLDEETCGRLREYLRTSHACAAAIRLLTRVRPAAIVKLHLNAITEDGSEITIEGVTWQVPEYARGIFRAHLVRRATEGANRDDRLLLAQPRNKLVTPTEPLGERGLQMILARMQRETGLPLTGDLDAPANEAPSNRQLRDWALRVGLTLKPLTPITYEHLHKASRP